MKNKQAKCMLCTQSVVTMAAATATSAVAAATAVVVCFVFEFLFASFNWATAEVVFQLYGLLTHIGRMFKHIIRSTYMALDSIYLHQQIHNNRLVSIPLEIYARTIYLCAVRTLIQHSAPHIYANVKWTLNKSTNKIYKNQMNERHEEAEVTSNVHINALSIRIRRNVKVTTTPRNVSTLKWNKPT